MEIKDFLTLTKTFYKTTQNANIYIINNDDKNVYIIIRITYLSEKDLSTGLYILKAPFL